MTCNLPSLDDVKLGVWNGKIFDRTEACDGFFHYAVYAHKNHEGKLIPRESVLFNKRSNSIVYCQDREEKQDIKYIPESFEDFDFKFFEKANKDHGGIWKKVETIETFPSNIMFRVLIICGESGHGKSFLAKALRNQEQRKGKNIEYITWLNLISKFRAMEKDSINDLLDSDILIIDDFGEDEQKESGWVEENLKYMLDIFIQERNPEKLVLTTNMNTKGIMEKYGEKISGRILKDSTTVEINGPNYYFKREAS